MKIVALLLLISITQTFALESYAQTKQLSLSFRNETILNILDKIEDLSEFYFMYDATIIDVSQRKSINCENKPITTILDQLLKDTKIIYEISDRQIVLTRAQNTEVAQQKTVSGKITDTSGTPLPGVTVVVKGTTQGIITDFDGKYTLVNVPGDATLVFSFVGMKTQEIPVAGKSTINVVLAEDAIGIEEVVAVGYGTQKKVNITGAITAISNEYLDSRSSSTVSQLLQGQTAGVDLGVGNTGFAPGTEMKINIRGMGSINETSALVVIDGIPGELDNLNPEDIKSISILKDAASSAIYGARAAHGVILVTTKSGSKKDLTATYNGSVMINYPMELPNTLDSYTFARVHNEAAQNRGSRYYSNAVVDRIIAYQDEDWDYLRQFMPEGVTNFESVPLSDGTWGVKWDANANNDWLDIFFGEAVNHKHNFSIDGGSDKVSYYFSAGYVNENSYINYTDDKFERYNITGKIRSEITDWWDFTIETRFTKGLKTRPTLNLDDEGYLDFFRMILESAPTNPMYDGYGNINARIGNYRNLIMSMQEGGRSTTETTEQLYTFYTTLKPAKGWQVNGDFTYQSLGRFGTLVNRLVPYYKVNQSVAYDGTTNSITSRHNNDYYWTSNVYTSYDLNTESGHNLRVMAGMQFEYDIDRYLLVSKKNLLVEDVPSINTAIGDMTASEILAHWSTQGYFGRLNYNYKEKYLLESNVRYDGTSRFSSGNRWGFFPSASVGWVASNESFWEPISSAINTLKLKASWGSLGNQNISPYQDMQLIPIEPGTVNWLYANNGSKPVGYTDTPNIASPGLTWETVTTKNIGMEMGLFDRKLQLGFDLYERNTTDMIGPAEAQPGVLGASLPKTNNASLRTNGWELEIGWKQKLSNDFSYSVNLNLYDNKTVITKYNNPTKLLKNWYEGKTAGEIWGYTSNGLFQSQEEIDNHASQSFFYGTWRLGDVKYEDLDGNEKVNNGSNTLDDHGDMKIIGNNMPRYQFGLSASASYKGFDFSMLWRGVAKKDIDQHFVGGYGSEAYFGFLSQTWSSIFDYHLDYYRDKPGDKYTGLYEGDANINLDAWYPKPYLSSAENPKNRKPSTRYLLNGAYARLQNVQLGYSFPSRITDKLGLSKLRVYVSGDNLITLSHLPKGIDPVATVGYAGTYLGNTYGAPRVIAFGLTISTK